MTEAELHFGQRVAWTNRAGTTIAARIVDIDPGKDVIQIRVLHRRGAQLLWVHGQALAPLSRKEPTDA
jgi:ribosomal protein L35AE/L33A